MPETVPVIERIALAIRAKLLTIQPPDYLVKVADVLRPLKTGVEVPAGHMEIVMLQQPPQPDWEQYAINGCQAWGQPFTLDLTLRPSADETKPIDTLGNEFAAAVMKAMLATPQWGRLACDTKCTGWAYMRSTDGKTEGPSLEFTVWYRHPEGDPYTAVP